ATVNATDFTISWNPAAGLSCTDCLMPLAQPPVTTTYTATVTDLRGCTGSDNMTIRVAPNTPAYLPNAFSPNGDGRNDFLTIYTGTGVSEVLLMEVYNRWGGLVYQAQRFAPGTSGWDGNTMGETAPAGTYLCRARLRLIDGQEVEISGEVLLVR
ncbi:MAG: gliding motility-associated C-terminal domain-containing protein, partial [Mameliella sp.]|nr:gliding motility-associated C-terminal domain-containing protein [Phaeodactylibacter sp.]